MSSYVLASASGPAMAWIRPLYCFDSRSRVSMARMRSTVSCTISAFFRHRPMAPAGIGPEGSQADILEQETGDTLEVVDVLPVNGHAHGRADPVAPGPGSPCRAL